MGNKVTDEQVSLVRSVVGNELSEMDVIRALHLANNDASAAINIIFDMPPPPPRDRPCVGGGPLRVRASDRQGRKSQASLTENPSGRALSSLSDFVSTDFKLSGDVSLNSTSAPDWWLAGMSELTCLSTCKGRTLGAGEKVSFSFRSAPLPAVHGSPSPGKLPAKGHRIAPCSGIVRFSTEGAGEIGRIPNEWARCLIPLVASNKIRVEGCSKSTHSRLNIMDPIILRVSVYMDISMFQRCPSVKLTRTASEESAILPLPSLFKLLALTPFKKASLTPDDISLKKRTLELKGALTSGKSRKLSSTVVKVDNEHDGDFTGFEDIVGFTGISELEMMDPPNSLVCELWPYQKQALYWMFNVERGKRLEEAATSLHPCWDAYYLADKRQLAVYVNVFSGDATIEFPSTVQMSKGGILADTMGLGKTVMTISLLLTHSGRGGPGTTSIQETGVCDGDAVTEMFDQSSQPSEKTQTASGGSSFGKPMKPGKIALIQGCNLIVCPMTLLGQWKTEIETHTRPGSVSVYVHYGQSRPKDAQHLAEYDVVLTTYGVLSSEFSAENSQDNGGLYCVQWFRVVLDEAHTIKSSRSQVSLATASLNARLRWCLTGTPIQNSLEDIYSLLRFLKVEPWANWNLWNKFVQKPYEEGDEHGLKLIQSILRPIMLRRTKSSKDKEGRPIVVLPPINTETIYCELNEAERDFYEALFRRSKVKFNQFVEQGRVLHNYASILELLLRLRQCCDHPFLVLSRGDTQDFSDLNKLATRLLNGDQRVVQVESGSVPSRAYIKEVVEELRKGEKGECPICLEVFEDAVITPCVHRMCRECLLTSWKSPTNGFCPICRKAITKHDLITAPTESRFHIDVERNWVESSKISALFKELEVLRRSGSKCIIFSQWTAFLDLLEIPLSRNSFRFVRLDGTLNQQQRENVISKFGDEDDILVLLMSLKAGGVGINLTAASNAFLLDPWWNPAVEEQAVMRIHRIGQSKSVSVKRFIVKGTVEERMEAVQARKQRMISGALTDQEVRTARIEELKLLFT